MRRRTWVAAATVLLTLQLAAGCATTGSPGTTPVVTLDSLVVDPQAGFAPATPSPAPRAYDAALRELASGRVPEAQRRLLSVQQRNPEFLPASVALAAIALDRDDFDRAESILESVLERQPDYVAARILSAELAGERDDLQQAYTIYRDVSMNDRFPEASRERLLHYQQQWFDRLYSQAIAESSPERSIELLRQALTVVPEARAARQMLVDRLISAGKFDDARRQVEPLVDRARPNAPEVEAALAEIDFGKGRYQEAIERLEPLARSDPARYAARLEEVKQRWSETNMPPRYHRALASPALTRAELAVLLYWKLPFVRFAKNISQPPIAIDISEVEGREEFVRALALRFYDVDPVTRAAYPYRTVSTDNFTRLAGRLLILGGTPDCAASIPNEGDSASARSMLRACNIPIASLRDPSVTGKTAGEVLDAVADVVAAR